LLRGRGKMPPISRALGIPLSCGDHPSVALRRGAIAKLGLCGRARARVPIRIAETG
jgi:hypothetical protein